MFIEEAKEELVDYRSEVERIFKSMDLWSESIIYNKLN